MYKIKIFFRIETKLKLKNIYSKIKDNVILVVKENNDKKDKSAKSGRSEEVSFYSRKKQQKFRK